MTRRYLLLLLTLVAPPVWAGSPLTAFVSVPPQRYLVERVGGEHVMVEVMVGPGQSPATYEPSARQMTALGDARLFFAIGVPFEQVWLPRVRSIYPDLEVIDTRADIELRQVDAGPHGGHNHHGHRHDGQPDPHVWTSPPLLRIQARHVASALIAADPDRAATYRRNLATLEDELIQLDAALEERLAPLAGRSFMVFHPSWGYFADRYGLSQLPIEMAGRSPGARGLREVMEQGRELRIGVIFVQPQFSSRSAEVVAEGIGARVVVADPLATDLPANLMRVADLLVENLTPP